MICKRENHGTTASDPEIVARELANDMTEQRLLEQMPDGRCRLLALTEKGSALTAHFRSAIEDTDTLFRSALTAEEQQSLLDMLSKIVANLESEVHHP